VASRKLVVLGGALSILLALPHAGLGWPSVAGRLADAQTAPDLIAGLAVAWYFGSAAMVALGGVVIALGSRVASHRRAFCAVLCVGVFYASVGIAAALYRGPKPQFVVFVATGALIVLAAMLARRVDD
jgi:hypothetical protein